MNPQKPYKIITPRPLSKTNTRWHLCMRDEYATEPKLSVSVGVSWECEDAGATVKNGGSQTRTKIPDPRGERGGQGRERGGKRGGKREE